MERNSFLTIGLKKPTFHRFFLPQSRCRWFLAMNKIENPELKTYVSVVKKRIACTYGPQKCPRRKCCVYYGKGLKIQLLWSSVFCL
ncbi:hypothetical protein HanIR_Chr14g0687961 [Helianthus annuus]|nr:hypothetical protein HanIR_Chr14g0687961 [Helianthus annuus]